MSLHKVLKAFDQAVDCRTTVSHKKGDVIEVPTINVKSWAEEGWIDSDTTTEEAAPTDTADTADDDDLIIVIGEEEVLLSEADKDQLEAYALAQFEKTLDKRKSTEKLQSEVRELINTGKG